MTSAIVNRFPSNMGELPSQDVPVLAERISDMKHRPDLIGLSYWRGEEDPTPTLEWLESVTGYPPARIYVDEVGATEGKQAERLRRFIPKIWEFGVKIINVWMWRQTWCGDKNHGMWQQLQPCEGRVIFGDQTDGLQVIQDFIQIELALATG